METVTIQVRAPRGMDPGKVIEGHYDIIGDTVVLVDRSGKPLTSDDKRYERKFTAGENTKQIAAQLSLQCGARCTPRGFDDAIRYPKLKY